MQRFHILALAGLLTLGVVGVAGADEAEDAIKYRKGVFQVVKWNFGPMGAMVKGKIPYDKDAFAAKAENVAAVSGMALEGFPEGSDFGADTTAKANIWEEWDKFKGGMEKFDQEAKKLSEVAKTGDMDAIKPQFAAVADTCKGCHDNFRKE